MNRAIYDRRRRERGYRLRRAEREQEVRNRRRQIEEELEAQRRAKQGNDEE